MEKKLNYMIILSQILNWLNNNLIIIICILLIIMSIIVLTRINPMISLFNLILFYILLGLLLYNLNLNILGLLYILVYVGAISVLFIFILSLINIKYSELYYKSYSPDIFIIMYTFILLLLFIINNNNINIDLNYLMINESQLSINNIMKFKIIGELIYTEYAITLIILGLILLLSIIAAILLIYR